MSTPPTAPTADYEQLLTRIVEVHREGQARAYRAINTAMLETYRAIGQYIVEFEQGGQAKAAYGAQLLKRLSRDLTRTLGRGYSHSNLVYIRLFYLKYPKSVTLSHQLSWSHYYELLKVDDEAERSFYEKQALADRWNVRELRRQIDSALYLRLALSTDQPAMLAQTGHVVTQPRDLVRDTYVLEFLKVPVGKAVSERELETRLVEHLQTFLLELGKGFTFVGRQYPIPLEGDRYKVDLVFYHRILRCFVLIDLKIKEVKHQDIGQMNMYLGYFAEEENTEGDNPPIGIILTRQKNDLLVRYATYGLSSQLFVSKYQLYLPDEGELRRELQAVLDQEPEAPNA